MAQLITVRLSRSDAQPWGFRLQGGKDFGTPLLIQKVNGGSLADQVGLVAGDAVLKINNQEVFNLRHKDAQDCVVRAGNSFEVCVQRGGSTWKPSVTPTGNLPSPNSQYGGPVTRTSLIHKQPDVHHIGSGHNSAARPFGAVNGDGSVKSIVNKQYNTPVGIYSDESIAETLSAQAEVLAGGVLGVNFKKNEKMYNSANSEVYKMLQEQDNDPEEPAGPQGQQFYWTASHAIGGQKSPHSFTPNSEHHHQQQQQQQHQQFKHEIHESNQQHYEHHQEQQMINHDEKMIGTILQQHTLAPSAVHRPSLPKLNNDYNNSAVNNNLNDKINLNDNLLKNPTCDDCSTMITGVFVRIKDKNLHVDCFKCATCGSSLKNQGYFNINNKLYCDIHAKMAALASPPPGTEGMIPIPIKPNTKLGASTISAALNSHIANTNGSPQLITSPNAPGNHEILSILKNYCNNDNLIINELTTAISPSNHLHQANINCDKNNINNQITSNEQDDYDKNVIKPLKRVVKEIFIDNNNLNCKNNNNNNINENNNNNNNNNINENNNITNENDNNNNNIEIFKYQTIGGDTIRTVIPPGKNVTVQYKVNTGGPKPFSYTGGPPMAGPKSPSSYPPPSTNQQPSWQQQQQPQPQQHKPMTTFGPANTMPRASAGQNIAGRFSTYNTNKQGYPTQNNNNNNMKDDDMYHEDNDICYHNINGDDEVHALDKQLNVNPTFNWPPRNLDNESLPTASPLYIPPPETQHNNYLINKKSIKNCEIVEQKYQQKQQLQQQQQHYENTIKTASSTKTSSTTKTATAKASSMSSSKSLKSSQYKSVEFSCNNKNFTSSSSLSSTTALDAVATASASATEITDSLVNFQQEEQQQFGQEQNPQQTMYQMYATTPIQNNFQDALEDLSNDNEVAAVDINYQQDIAINGRKSAQECAELLTERIDTQSLINSIKETTPKVPSFMQQMPLPKPVKKVEFTETIAKSAKVEEEQQHVEIKHLDEIKLNVKELPPCKLLNTLPQEYKSPMLKALETAPIKPFNMDHYSEMLVNEHLESEKQELNEEICTQRQVEKNNEPTPIINVNLEQVIGDPPKEKSFMANVLTTAPLAPLEFVPKTTMDPIQLPEETTPYFPPQTVFKSTKKDDSISGKKSPFLSALITAPDRPYSPFSHEVMYQLDDLPTPKGKMSMSTALAVAPDATFSPYSHLQNVDQAGTTATNGTIDYKMTQQISAFANVSTSSMTMTSSTASAKSFKSMECYENKSTVVQSSKIEQNSQSACSISNTNLARLPPHKQFSGLHKPEQIPDYQKQIEHPILPPASPILKENVPIAFLDMPKEIDSHITKPVAISGKMHNTADDAIQIPCIIPKIIETTTPNTMNTTIQSLEHDDNRFISTERTASTHVTASGRLTPLRPFTPSSMINKPAPTIPYYQQNLITTEHGAMESHLYRPSSRTPSPCPRKSPACYQQHQQQVHNQQQTQYHQQQQIQQLQQQQLQQQTSNTIRAHAPRLKDKSEPQHYHEQHQMQINKFADNNNYENFIENKQNEVIIKPEECIQLSNNCEKKINEKSMKTENYKELEKCEEKKIGNMEIKRKTRVVEEYERKQNAKIIEVRQASNDVTKKSLDFSKIPSKAHTMQAQTKMFDDLTHKIKLTENQNTDEDSVEVENLVYNNNYINNNNNNNNNDEELKNNIVSSEKTFPQCLTPEPISNFPIKNFQPKLRRSPSPQPIPNNKLINNNENTHQISSFPPPPPGFINNPNSIIQQQSQNICQQQSLSSSSSVCMQKTNQFINQTKSLADCSLSSCANAVVPTPKFNATAALTQQHHQQQQQQQQQQLTSSMSASTISTATNFNNNNININNNNNNKQLTNVFMPNKKCAINAASSLINNCPGLISKNNPNTQQIPKADISDPSPASAGSQKSGTIGATSAPKRGRGILNKAAGPGTRQPLCGCCNQQVRGPFITALGRIWTPDHFVCVNSSCRRPLQDIGFVEEKGDLYCEYCFEKYIAPNCSKCSGKIKGDCLNAIGKHYHPECFTCTYCGKLFGNSPFFLEEGEPYCEADWNELFTTKCFACGFPVEAGDRWVEALAHNYHSQCFNCTMCKKNLEGQSFYAKGGRPFCKNHAR